MEKLLLSVVAALSASVAKHQRQRRHGEWKFLSLQMTWLADRRDP